jgi:hypothetical protein
VVGGALGGVRRAVDGGALGGVPRAVDARRLGRARLWFALTLEALASQTTN